MEGTLMTPEEKLAAMGLAFATGGGAAGNYVAAVRTGNLVFLSGHGPRRADGTLSVGRVGKEVSVEMAYEAAKRAALECLRSLKAEIGELSKVRRIVKLLGMVNCTEDFLDHPKVLNGASDLLVELFGESGRHARSAVGMQGLPFGMSVEIEMVVEVAPRRSPRRQV